VKSVTTQDIKYVVNRRQADLTRLESLAVPACASAEAEWQSRVGNLKIIQRRFQRQTSRLQIKKLEICFQPVEGLKFKTALF